MIPSIDVSAEFSELAKNYKRTCQEFLLMLPFAPYPLSFPQQREAFLAGQQLGHVYVLKSGMLSIGSNEKHLYLHDEGDLIWPDSSPESSDSLTYAAQKGALLAEYRAKDILDFLGSSPKAVILWTQMLNLRSSMLARLLAAHTEANAYTQPTLVNVPAGEQIIKQGAESDHVITLFEGEADVVVDGIKVGEVKQGEVIGAMALLTDSPRSATVRARSDCTILKVAGSDFEKLIRSKPSMIHSLLRDMANSIKSLNQKVVKMYSPTKQDLSA